MKITRNTTMEQLKNVLGANAKLVQKADKDLYEQVAYTSKAMKNGEKVAKKDLVDLVKAVMKSLGDKFVEPALAEEVKAENSVKPSKKLSKTKKTGKAEQSTETVKEEKVDKKSAKKSQEDDSVVSVLNGVVKSFAKEWTDSEGVKYVRADDIKTMEDLAKEDLDKVVFAIYYNKSQLEEFGYSDVESIDTPVEFPNDLDLCSPMWVSQEGIITYVLSLYTENVYAIGKNNFKAVNGVRYIDDIEFQIYRVEQ